MRNLKKLLFAKIKRKRGAFKKVDDCYYKLIMNRAPVGMLLFDQNFEVLYVNKIAYGLFGYEKTEEERLSDVFSFSYFLKVNLFEKVGKCLSEKEALFFEVDHKLENNELIFLKYKISPLYHENGNFMGVEVLIINNTEKRSIERHYKNFQKKYKKLMETANDGIIVSDVESGVILDVNKKMEEMLEMGYGEIVGKHQSTLHPEDHQHLYEKFFNHDIKCEGKITVDDINLYQKKGGLLPVEISSSITEIDGQKLRLGIVHDISRRKHVQSVLEYRVHFVEIITEISTSFINLELNNIDEEINKALERIGEFAGVDISYIYILSEDGKKISSSHEWRGPHLGMRQNNSNGLLLDAFPWFSKKLRNFDYIYLPDVEDLPKEAIILQKRLQQQKIKSMLIVPMLYRGKLFGFLGFDAIKSKKEWSNDLIVLSKIVGGVFVNALNRKKVEEEKLLLTSQLSERVKELKCLYDISKIARDSKNSFDYFLQGVTNMITETWHYPDITCARIVFDNNEFKTDNFKQTEWRQFADIYVSGKRKGFVEVYYLEEKPQEYEGPFLKEERDFINSLSRELGILAERKLSEQALQESDMFNKTLIDTIPFGMDIIDMDCNILFMCEKMKKFTNGNKIGQKCWDSYRRDRTQCANCPLKSGIELGETKVVEIDNALNGKVFQVYHTGMIYKGQKAVLELFVDVSETKDIENKLFESYKYLGVINRRISILSELSKQKKDKKKIIEFILQSALKLSEAKITALYKFNFKENKLSLISNIGGRRNLYKEVFINSLNDNHLINDLLKNAKRIQGNCFDFGESFFKDKCSCQFVFVPLLIKKNVYAVILLCFFEERNLTSQELSFFDVFGLQAAINLESVI